MNVSLEAQAIASVVLDGVAELRDEVGGELRARAIRTTEMATQLYLNQLAGIDTESDRAIIEARFQALKAAGAVALAETIVAGLRAAVTKGLTVLATM